MSCRARIPLSSFFSGSIVDGHTQVCTDAWQFSHVLNSKQSRTLRPSLTSRPAQKQSSLIPGVIGGSTRTCRAWRRSGCCLRADSTAHIWCAPARAIPATSPSPSGQRIISCDLAVTGAQARDGDHAHQDSEHGRLLRPVWRREVCDAVGAGAVLHRERGPGACMPAWHDL